MDQDVTHGEHAGWLDNRIERIHVPGYILRRCMSGGAALCGQPEAAEWAPEVLKSPGVLGGLQVKVSEAVPDESMIAL